MTIATPRTLPPPARRRRWRRTAAVVGIALVAAVAACSDDDEGSTSTGAGAESGSGDMSISIEQPTDGATVQVPFDVQLDTSVDLGEPDTGLHHVHLYYDGATGEGDYDIVYDDSPTVERQLSDGEHTIEAVIANADHSLTDARDEITVQVGDTAGGGSTPGSDGTTEDPYSGGGY